LKRNLVYRDRMKLFGVNVPCRFTDRLNYDISKEGVRALKEGDLWVPIWFVNNVANGQ